jgi:hypothetical protein
VLAASCDPPFIIHGFAVGRVRFRRDDDDEELLQNRARLGGFLLKMARFVDMEAPRAAASMVQDVRPYEMPIF